MLKQALKNHLLSKYVVKRFKEVGKDSVVFDVNTEIDNTLTYQENKNQMCKKIDIILPSEIPEIPKLNKSKVIQIRLDEVLYNDVMTEFPNKNLSEHLRNYLIKSTSL